MPKRKAWDIFKQAWPLFIAGAIFAGALVWVVLQPHAATVLLAAGAGLVFALFLAYMRPPQASRFTLTSLLAWFAGLSLAIITVLVVPSFLTFSGLFVFAAASYGLSSSSRRTMRIGAIAAIVTLAICFGISLLSEAGVLTFGILRPPLALQAGMLLVCLLLAANNLQRLWRHYNRTAAAYRDLRTANEALLNTQAELQRHVQEQTELLEVSRVIRSTQEMGPLLDEILLQMKRVVDYNMASVLVLLDGEVVAVRRAGPPQQDETKLVTALMATPQWAQLTAQKQPVIIDDVYRDVDFLAPFDRILGPDKPAEETPQHSWMGLPLVARGELVGAVSVTHNVPAFFNAERVEMAFAFANHAAVAIESSRKKDEAVSAAALAERARLARELHDSVSQALYGMVLTTRTALELIDHDPARARDTMRYTIELADAALSEMRALIFELRPESLRDEGVLAALRKQAVALTARHKIELQLDLCAEEPALRIEAKEALYRIAMEAIQNTIRHAGAHKLRLTMTCDENVSLVIEDDGIGFDPQISYAGHFGLQNMRERAHALGGEVTIHSRRNEGTRVRVTLPARPPAPPENVSDAV